MHPGAAVGPHRLQHRPGTGATDADLAERDEIIASMEIVE
jgi:hypothetical protein